MLLLSLADDFLLVEELGDLLLLGIDELKCIIILVNLSIQLHIHALFNGRDETSTLDELSNRRLAVEPPRDAHLHCVRYLLDLAQAVLVDETLSLVHRGTGGYRCYCRLILRVFEDESNHCVYIPDRHIEFVVEVKSVIELVMDYNLGLRNVLRRVPETLGLLLLRGAVLLLLLALLGVVTEVVR